MSYIYFIGIDVSKETLDVALDGSSVKPQRYPNTSGGFAAFASANASLLPQALVVLEATGGYESALLAHLLQAGWKVHRADPRAASYFIRSLGKRAKTDRLDALALAKYGRQRHAELPLARLHEEAQARLISLLARRSDLIAMRVAEQNRLQHPVYASLHESLHAMLNAIDAQIKTLHQAIEAIIEQSPAMAAKLAVMTGIKGLGKQTAYTLLGLMPELGTLTRRQAASLSGLAPHPKDSGKTNGYRATTGGRQSIKRALFMAAMSARNFHPQLKNFYNNLIQNGKKPMVALVAVMRKLITIINAKIRDQAFA